MPDTSESMRVGNNDVIHDANLERTLDATIPCGPLPIEQAVLIPLQDVISPTFDASEVPTDDDSKAEDKLYTRQLVVRAQEGDDLALEGLVVKYSDHIRAEANDLARTIYSTIDADDLYQEGVIGLIEATRRADTSGTYEENFKTYADYWIKQKMLQCKYTVRVPRGANRLVNKVLAATADNEASSMSQPQLDAVQVGQLCGISPSKEEAVGRRALNGKLIIHAIALTRNMGSVDAIYDALDSSDPVPIRTESGALLPVNEGPRSIFSDDPREFDTDFEEADMVATVRQALKNVLRESDRKIIHQHYGFFGNEPLTHLEIGTDRGVSAPRITFIHLRILRQLGNLSSNRSPLFNLFRDHFLSN
jgi:RNA polymerase sigma factor (sigma-70 family)